ncbi:MAG: hypothetical protein HC827_04385 [Cyanobacteria bacterium RM1_2_2]|nr:hypothetical protein [Cyanobacteria bacterium RM1_2_2]
MKYLKTYFAVVLTLLFAIGLLNILVDPLWYLKGNQITGINPPWNERIAKTNLFLNHKQLYDCLLIGTSRSTLFDTDLLEQNRCFNYSFSGGKIEEYVTYLTYLRNQGILPEKIYVEIELSSFNRRAEPRIFDPVSDTLPAYRAYFFSGNVLQLSIRTLIQAYEFSRLYDQNFRGILSDSVPDFEPEFSSDAEQRECDPNRIEFLTKLRQIFPEATFVGFVAPLSGWYVFNDSYASGLLGCQLAGIHQLASVFDQVYDFTVPSAITTRTDNTYDGNHYYPRVYRQVAKRLEGDSSNFGIQVDPLSLSDYQTLYLNQLNRFLARENQPPAKF